LKAIGEQKTNDFESKTLSCYGMDVPRKQLGDLTQSRFNALAYRLGHKLFI
jgi:hypothetical protein